MKAFCSRVNIIPVIGRSDSLLPAELAGFKKRILEDLKFHDISIFGFPSDEEDDEATIRENSELANKLPFAIVGSEGEFVTQGRPARGRKYPWGIVEVDNEKHCDFSHLRHILLVSHLTDLKDHTEDHLYETYRTERLSQGENM